MVADREGEVVYSIDQVDKNDSVDVRLYDGVIGCNVVEIEAKQE